MRIGLAPLRRLRGKEGMAALFAFGLLGLAAPAIAQAPGQGLAGGGTARIWVLRDYEPSVSLNMAPVELNGRIVGYAQPDGSAFYRDVPAGHYRISVQSDGRDVNQDKQVDLAPGQEVFVKVTASGSWEESGDMSSYKRDTFYVSLLPPQRGRAELANHRLGGG